ncbi:MAG: nucleoside 2-deoxyribosyltransferase [Candidatus Dojkabacteria bacterium]|nr:nucleoside 2-deoxyribosyltransferase [Candidatus Dojkabacteria bacterium]
MKKIFIAYKHAGKDEKRLQHILEWISQTLESKGYKTFIYRRDVQGWDKITQSGKQIILGALENLRECDAIFAYVDSPGISEGLSIEIGYAKAKGKRVYLAINKSLSPEAYRFLRGLADKTIEFSNTTDLSNQIKELL